MAMPACIRVPQVSREELFAFHEAHFSHLSAAKFSMTFMGLSGPNVQGDSDAEYHDQCEKSLLEKEDNYDPEADLHLSDDHPDLPLSDLRDRQAETGETTPADGDSGITAAGETNLVDDRDEQDQSRKKRRRKKINTGNSSVRRLLEKKPDLRKRTWDVVDTGLGSLDYDGVEKSADLTQSAPARRRIQYGDD
ncbi:hypothetical protein SEPCBS57363_004275 [Sporothrix epigloea]|uniref:Uncharacterized protein n=1 Tax=Sporothrix epigloea TaxID=1892477 RepID=A0ABP0DUW1_9PEZI